MRGQQLTTEDRRAWALHAIEHYRIAKGYQDFHDDEVQDLISDLLHTLKDADAEMLMERALRNYISELGME